MSSDNLHFHPYKGWGDDDTYARAGWTLQLRDGQELLLGLQFRNGDWQRKDAVAARIVERVMAAWQ